MTNMKTKSRTYGPENWILSTSGPLGPFTTEKAVYRHDKITYSVNKPAYVSFNTCSHTRGCADGGLRIPTSPIAIGQHGYPTVTSQYAPGEVPVRVDSISRVTSAYSLDSARVAITSRDYEARVYDAVLSAYAQARSIPSILQPVIELKDVKQTVKQASALCDWLLKRPSSIRQYIRKGYSFGRVMNDFLRSITETSSNAYLMSTFGVLPTVGDAQRIARSVANPNRLVKARSNIIPKNTVLRAGFRCLTEAPSFDMSARVEMSSYSVSREYAAPFWNGIDTTEGISALASSLIGDRKWFDVTDVHGLVFIKARVNTSVDNSLLNDWNFTQAPGAIPWELVPFSFVVDWFYDVGDQLQRAERRANVYRRVRISDFSTPWVCTHRDKYTLSASCSSSSSFSNYRAFSTGFPTLTIRQVGDVVQKCVRTAMKNYTSREFERGPWQGHLYDLPAQEFNLPVRPYQVAASLALLAQQLTRLGRS